MTVASTTVAVVYAGNSSATGFSVTFPFFEITVESIAADGTLSTEVEGSDYTVTGGEGATGTVTMGVAPATGTWLVIRRTTSRLQATDYIETEAFPAETHEQALDRLAMINAEHDALHTAPILPSYTAAQIADATHAVNTTGKKAGRVVLDTTNERVMIALGRLAASEWTIADGSATVTPA